MTDKRNETYIEKVLSSISIESIISGFRNYRTTFRSVIQSPRNFVRQRDLLFQAGMFQSALSTYFYGVALSFLIYLPLVQKHGLEIGKIYFLLQSIYFQVVQVCLIYLSVKVFRGRGTLAQTATAYCIWMGIWMPIGTVLIYPILYYLPVENFILFQSSVSDMHVMELLPKWVLIWTVLLYLIMLVTGFITIVQWVADVHKITKLKFFVACIVIYSPVRLVYEKYFIHFTSQIIRHISDILQRIL